MCTLCEIVDVVSSSGEYMNTERFVLISQALLPTRRWFNTILDDSHLLVHCSLSSLVHREEDGHLFSQVSPGEGHVSCCDLLSGSLLCHAAGSTKA